MPRALRYRVDLAMRRQHLVTVTLEVPAELAPGARVALATWTPGSYVVRDHVHHVQSARALDATGRPVPLESDATNSWVLPRDVSTAVDVSLEFHANTLSVRTNHVDERHALIHGAASFPWIDGHRHLPIEVVVEGVGADETVHALLPEGPPGTWRAEDHDHLADAAFEVGALPAATRTIEGVDHTVVWAGHGPSLDLDAFLDDLERIAREAVALLGPLPCDRYVILVEGGAGGGGGLEHRDGTVLEVPTARLTDPALAARVRSLVAHEYLHLWNVERLTPRALVRPDLDAPRRTESLWVAEGWTSHYDALLPTRAGLWDAPRLLTRLSDTLALVTATPGVDRQSLRQASLEAWTKHYVRDENSPNAGTDYYAHGALVALETDLALRASGGHGSDGLDDVLRTLWHRHAGDAGYTETDVIDAITHHGGEAIAARIEGRVATPGPPVLDDVLPTVGLTLARTDATVPVTLGVRLSARSHPVRIEVALRDGPAWRAGLVGGDALLALDGRVVHPARLDRQLADRAPGEVVTATVRRAGRILDVPVTLDAAPARVRIAVDPEADDDARTAFLRWCGQPLPARAPDASVAD